MEIWRGKSPTSRRPWAEPAASLRNVIVWLFIALVALFLTHPSSPASVFDAPVPWPAELGIDTNLGM